MTAGTYNMTIEQGATWNTTLTLYTDEARTTPDDVSGYTAKMHIRPTKDSPVLIKGISSGDGITITTNVISLLISAEDTASFNFSKAYYDLELTNGTSTTRLIEGTVTLSAEVTR